MKKRILCLALAVVLILGLAAPAVAAGQTFSDVPSSYWGYADIEAAAEAGLMNGTGNGKFSPNLKVSVAQFLTLLGRLVFPDTKVAEGDTWYGPYVIKAQGAGLLTGTQVDTGNVEAEISRYDMAVILRAAAKRLGVKEKSAQSSEVTDYLDISTRYADAVLAVYGMGLIKGDQNGNFNGSSTMTRAEVATVIMRLAKTPEATAWVEAWDVYEMPRTGEYVTVKVSGWINAEVIAGAKVGFYYKDGRQLGEMTIATTSMDGTTYRTPWSMDVTMDKADYSETEELYYATLIGQAKERVLGGMLEASAEQCTPQKIKKNFEIKIRVVETEQSAEPKQMDLEGWMRYGTNGDPRQNGAGVEGVPFQLRYTEDAGATYQVIAEGVTGRDIWYGDDCPGHFELTAQVDKFTFNKYWNGNGQLYISAETTVNGQKYVTQDRRTDGKATIIPIGRDWSGLLFVNLVPPDRGETVDITVKGRMEAITYVVGDNGVGRIHHYNSGYDGVLTNSTVKVYFDSRQEGVPRVLLGETTADGGSFNESMTIDTAYYRTTGAYYVVEVEATLDGQVCKQTNNLEPITLHELAGNLSGLWYAKSDEYFELFLKEPRP